MSEVHRSCYYSIRNNSGCLAIFFPSEWPCTCVRFVKLNRTIRSETDTDISSLIQPVWMRKLSQQQATQSQDVKKTKNLFKCFPATRIPSLANMVDQKCFPVDDCFVIPWTLIQVKRGQFGVSSKASQLIDPKRARNNLRTLW